jgi:uncharacterized membrane protein
MLLLLSFALGMTAGLRSLTAPAVAAWAAQLWWPAVRQSPLAFMAVPIAAYVLTALALVELVTDKLPFTPSRLTPLPLTARILMGGLCGATLGALSPSSVVPGAVCGALGGIAGAIAGYQARRALVMRLHIPDVVVALAEDAIAIGGALVIASRA